MILAALTLAALAAPPPPLPIKWERASNLNQFGLTWFSTTGSYTENNLTLLFSYTCVALPQPGESILALVSEKDSPYTSFANRANAADGTTDLNVFVTKGDAATRIVSWDVWADAEGMLGIRKHDASISVAGEAGGVQSLTPDELTAMTAADVFHVFVRSSDSTGEANTDHYRISLAGFKSSVTATYVECAKAAKAASTPKTTTKPI